MYSPKISEELIPKIYQIAKKTGVAMTTWVNRALEAALREHNANDGSETNDGRKEVKYDPLRP